MPYQSGTASSFSDLQSKIETFLTGTPAMTLTSGVLTKTGTDIHVAFSNSANHLGLDIGKSSSAGSLLYPPPQSINGVAPTVGMADQYYDTIVSIVWPINYEFFYFSTPVNEFRCVIEYNNGYSQNVGFGEIEKAVEMAGGTYIDGSVCRRYDSAFYPIDINSIIWNYATPYNSVQPGNNAASPLPFGWGRPSTKVDYAASTQVWAEANGFDWWRTTSINCTSSTNSGTKYARGTFTGNELLLTSSMVSPQSTNSIQTYNANNALVRIPLWGRAPSGNVFRLGGIANIRYTNIKHRNFGEIATIGPDKWKHYPAFFKNSDNATGGDTDSGQIGYAVRYDGP